MKFITITAATLAVATVSPPAWGQAVSPMQFVAKASASDKFEIDSAKLEMSSQNPALAKFANQMVVDHSKSMQMVKQAAQADKITPKPPMLDAKQTKDLAALRAANGTARDTLYIEQQKRAHAQALNLMKAYSTSGSATHLKAAAGEIVPVVQMHKDMIDKM